MPHLVGEGAKLCSAKQSVHKISYHLSWLAAILSLAFPSSMAVAQPDEEAGQSKEAPLGSPYIPMDSWIYAAMDRLNAFGLTPSQIAGLRPWTRLECHRLIAEAVETLPDKEMELGESLAAEAKSIIEALRSEFGDLDDGSPSLVLESVSTRNGFIAGTPLNDSYHFGQTWINDFGRPFGKGWNSSTEFSVRAQSGRFFAFLRGEYQHAPGRDAYPLEIRQLISDLDATPLQSAKEIADTDRFRLMDSYIGVRAARMDFSFGKQSLYYGPAYGAPLSFGNNAEPTKNLKISSARPFRVPGPMSFFGQARFEFVIGKLGGHAYTRRPWFNAQKLSFKPSDNLEFGVTRWALFWGVGHPITIGSFFRHFFSVKSTGAGYYGDPEDPGDRKFGLDFSYRIPWMRKWMTIYTDSFCDADCDHIPFSYAYSPGIYLSYIPGIPKLDFRAELSSTSPFDDQYDYGGRHLYWNGQYRSGSTNYGNLLGSWVGRDARAYQAWSTYWFSPRDKIEVSFRHSKGSGIYLPGGSTQTAAKITATFEIAKKLYAEGMMQIERFWVPALGGPERNISAWLRLTWEPKFALPGK